MKVINIITKHILDLTELNYIDPKENLFENQILNSLDVLDLIEFLEQTFGIDVAKENVNMEDFSSVEALASLIQRKAKNDS
jgi:acyl carrier protein